MNILRTRYHALLRQAQIEFVQRIKEMSESDRLKTLGERPTRISVTALFGDGGIFAQLGDAIELAFNKNNEIFLQADKLARFLKLVAPHISNELEQQLRTQQNKYLELARAGDRRYREAVISPRQLELEWAEARGARPSKGLKLPGQFSRLLRDAGLELHQLRDLDVWKQFLADMTYELMVVGRHLDAVRNMRVIETSLLRGPTLLAKSEEHRSAQLEGMLTNNAYIAHRIQPDCEQHYLMKAREVARDNPSVFLRLTDERHRFYHDPMRYSASESINLVTHGARVVTPGMIFADGGLLAYAAIADVLKGCHVDSRTGSSTGFSPGELFKNASDRQRIVGDLEGALRFQVFFAEALCLAGKLTKAEEELNKIQADLDWSGRSAPHLTSLLDDAWALYCSHWHDGGKSLGVAGKRFALKARETSKKLGLTELSSNYINPVQALLN